MKKKHNEVSNFLWSHPLKIRVRFTYDHGKLSDLKLTINILTFSWTGGTVRFMLPGGVIFPYIFKPSAIRGFN
jgi:hypothetical protein